MRVRTLIFDLDGTLVNSLPGIEFSVDAALAEQALPPRSSDLRALIGPPIRQILSAVAGPLGEAELTTLESSFRKIYDSGGWQKTVLFEGARSVLERAQAASIAIFIATNKPARATELILEGLNIRPFFAEVVCRDSTQPPFVSKAAMLRSLLAAHDFDKSSTLFVGDTGEDCEAGSAVGLPVVIVNHGYGGLGLNGHPDVLRIDNFHDLPI